MKKILFYASALLLVILVGCKKEGISTSSEAAKNSVEKSETSNKPFSRTAPSELKTGENGYLIFEDSVELKDYIDFLNSNSHQQIQEFLGSFEFKSRAKDSYTELTCDFYNVPTFEQQWDYILDENGVVEIAGVIIKVTEEEDFLYTVKEENFDGSVYENLAANIYDEYTMDKFITDRLASEDFELFSFINTWPYGYEETTVPSGEKRHPCIGSQNIPEHHCVPHGTEAGMCDCGDYDVIHHYFFWIETGPPHWGDVHNSVEVPCN